MLHGPDRALTLSLADFACLFTMREESAFGYMTKVTLLAWSMALADQEWSHSPPAAHERSAGTSRFVLPRSALMVDVFANLGRNRQRGSMDCSQSRTIEAIVSTAL
jgi:hypothetical protein